MATVDEAVTLNTVTRESFDNQGRQGNGESSTPSISGNQRYVAFQTTSNVWAPSVDTNGTSDIYLKDRQTGAVTLISAANGMVGNGGSFEPSVSDNGTVVFTSNATNLAPGASGPSAAILARTPDGVIRRVDVSFTGAGANGPSLRPQITSDGARIIYQSDGSNLVPDDTNGATDVFVGSPFGGAFRVSLTSSGGQANGRSFDGSVGDDGRFVSFASDATNIVPNDNNGVTDIFARDLQGAGVTVPISFTVTPSFATGNGASTQPRSSRDGRWVTFRSLANNFGATDTNGVADIYVNAIGSGQAPFRASVSSSGAQANGPSFQSALSFRGNAVAFVSSASNLVSGDTNFVADTFVRDLTTNQTIRIQRDAATQPNGSAVLNSSLSFSGNVSNPAFSFLAFDSLASNLVFGDTNNVADVFSASLSP